MLESLPALRHGSSLPPGETGPGPREIVTNSSDGDGDGYFGTLPIADFISPANLYTLSGITGGTLYTPANTTSWHKFLVDGKIVFIPQLPFASEVVWDTAAASGSVYGKEVVIGDYRFVLRFIRGDKTNPTTFPNSATYANTAFPWDSDKQTEWGRTITRLNNGQYAAITATNLGEGVGGTRNGSWCMESYGSTESAYAALRGANTINAYYVRNKSQARCWRPCLELIPTTS